MIDKEKAKWGKEIHVFSFQLIKLWMHKLILFLQRKSIVLSNTAAKAWPINTDSVDLGWSDELLIDVGLVYFPYTLFYKKVFSPSTEIFLTFS